MSDFFQLVSSTIVDWSFALVGIRIVSVSFDVAFYDVISLVVVPADAGVDDRTRKVSIV